MAKFGPIRPRLRFLEDWLGIQLSFVYMPTITNVTNVAGSTAYSSIFFRSGGFVTVAGKVDIDPTAISIDTEIGISLPVASDFQVEEDCAGSAITYALSGVAAVVYADIVNNRARLRYLNALDIVNRSWFFHFSYRVR